MKIAEVGLGTTLQALLASLDGGVQDLYAEEGERFRPRYYPVVKWLLDHESLSVSELAERCGVSQPAMTQTLAAMRRDAIVTAAGGADRRKRPVSLTSEGRAQAGRLRTLWVATARAASALEAECDAPLSALAGRLLAALDQKPFIDRIREEL